MVLALWVVAMLSTVAMLFAVAVRGRYHAEVYAWNDIEDMEAIQSLVLLVNRQLTFAPLEQLASENSNLSVLPMQSNRPVNHNRSGGQTLWGNALEMEGRIIPDGRDYTVKIEERQFRLSVTAEQGKVDVNTVPEVLLHQLLRWVLGSSSRDAESLADGLLDWRDKDNLVRLHGAEDEAYKRAKKPYVPANKPFHSVDEMRLVLGMTSELFYGPLTEEKGSRGREEWRGGLRDFFTVYNGSADVRLDYAPPPLRTFYKDMAIQGGGPLQAHSQGEGAPPPPQPPVAGQNTALGGGGGTPSQVVLLKVDTGHATYRIWFPANEGQGPPEILRVEEDMHAMMDAHVQK
jgi:hypothetical protein